MRGSFYNFHLCPRHLLFLSDGQFCFHFAQLAPSLNNLIHSNQLARFTIVRVVRHLYGPGPFPVIYIQELEIVAPGSQVGAKLGNPVKIGIDGKIPDPVRNKLTTLR